MARTMYDVKVKHPTGFHDGVKRLVVNDNYGGKSKYVTGDGFGCSRDYQTSNDAEAIRAFMSEHGCRVESIKAVKA